MSPALADNQVNAVFNLFVYLLVCLGCSVSASAREGEAVNAARIHEIAAWLPQQPAGLGQPITNRAAWESLATRHPELGKFILRATKLAVQRLPDQPDSLYLEFSKSGNRTRWQKVAGERRERIQVFTIAECLENKGRFLQPLEQTVAALCAERTWVLPAHDGQLENFKGAELDIDLGSSSLGVELATAGFLLGDRLSPATQKLIHENLERRIFAPYRAALDGTGKEFWWIHTHNNWNAVCLDGVTGAALATVSSPEERAWFIAAAEKNIDSYLTGGFTPDGYCVEGLGYWSYGFGNFTLLSENIREATGGKLDLLAKPLAAQPAFFGLRSEICNGVHTTIADCNPGERPSGVLMDYLCRRLGLDLAQGRGAELAGGLYEKMAYSFLPAQLPPMQSAKPAEELTWRTWFPEGGVLICRPGTNMPTPFAVAIKGGNNGVNHGHNDVGSFSLVVGKNMIVCDPGGEVYTKRTFSARRFDSLVLNSFGHAVPVVAGKLQATGADAHAVVLQTDFSPSADELKFDLRSAYPVGSLQKLERTFVFQRGANPSLTVRDELKFSTPERFETALVTWGQVSAIGTNRLEIRDGDSAVQVTIDTQGRAFHWRQETINEDVHLERKPIHIGIQLDSKISGGVVTLRLEPLPV